MGADWPDVSNILITRPALLRRRARRRAYAFFSSVAASTALDSFLHVVSRLSSQRLIALGMQDKKKKKWSDSKLMNTRSLGGKTSSGKERDGGR